MAIAFPNSPTNGQTVTISGVVYSWNSTTSTWDLVSAVSTLDQLQDVTAPTPADNNLLAYDTATSNWTNQTATQAGVAAAVHTHPQSDITNLVSDLAGKAATSHTHAQSAITNLVTDLAAKMPITTANLGNGDFNTYVTSGLYRFDIPTANGPGHSYGQLLVVRGGGSDTIGQTTWDFPTGAMFTRSANGIGGSPNWTAWKRIGMITYSTGDPSGGYNGDVWLKYTP